MDTVLDRPAPVADVASVSLADFAQDREAFAQALGHSFERYGFAVVSNHGISSELIARAEAASKALFALPVEAKLGYRPTGGGGQRGYTAFGVETAKDAKAVDLKEFWHVGRELPQGHRYADRMPPNIWPQELADFRAVMLELFAAFEATGLRLLEAIARHLGLAPDFFEDTVSEGNSVLRLLHYPPVQGGGPSIRAGAHEDINTITLLLGAEEAGLEILDRDGKWLSVTPREGELAVNVGDMLQRLTNDRLRSTTHRVANPVSERRGHPRYSMPFFLHFRPDYLIETLPGCVDAAHPDRYPEPITAHEYLMQRLREIKLL
ncbi:isopenicillin N synthase family oxygenase [Sphingomonas sp. CGMCC 1.13654]|uniref:2-oxoglutarate-dependent ethylene/succinate-forming enzyme n=1 Tax=Sphingomonas chungangi TaxID=2683589 RepID=A0A838L2M6_9SPHN|nr:isopenicillin N synthase family oxygenase [Sphingomonas chungangi]MBA2932772.1 isopenicillin N synthase family oxygenase [Sphingomonas chungangi]MVW56394.1 isopenicillin N synthase family oxygenase [Sphingomonas chungangi]